MNDDYNKSLDDILSQLSAQKHQGNYPQEGQTAQPPADFAATFAAATAQRAQRTEEPSAAGGDTIVISPTGKSTVHTPEAGLDVSRYKPKEDALLFDKEDESFKAFFTGTIESTEFDDEPKAKKKKGGLFGLFGKKKTYNIEEDEDFDFDELDDEDSSVFNEVMAELDQRSVPAAQAPAAAPAAVQPQAPKAAYKPLDFTYCSPDAPAPAAPAAPVEEQPQPGWNPFGAQDDTVVSPRTAEFAQQPAQSPLQDTPRPETAFFNPVTEQPAKAAPADGFAPMDLFAEEKASVDTAYTAPKAPAPLDEAFSVMPEGDLFGVVTRADAPAPTADTVGVSGLSGGAAAAAVDIAAAIAGSSTTSFKIPQPVSAAPADDFDGMDGFDLGLDQQPAADSFDLGLGQQPAATPDFSAFAPAQDMQSDLGDFSDFAPQEAAADPFADIASVAPCFDDDDAFGGADAFDDEEVYDEPAQPAVEEYTDRTQADAVHEMLQDLHGSLRVRTVALGVLSAFMLYAGIAENSFLPSLPCFTAAENPFMFMLAMLLAVVLAGLLAFSTVSGGFKGLVGTPTVDTFPTLALAGCAVQLLYFVIMPKAYDATAVTLFAAIGVLLMFANMWGKMVQAGVIEKNFEAVGSGEDLHVAFLAPDKVTAKQLCNGLGQRNPELLLSRKTGLLQGFIGQSFAVRYSDKRAQRLSLILLVSAIVCAVLCAIFAGGVTGAVTGLAAALCFGAPLAGSLLGAGVDTRLQKNAAGVGAVVPGWSAVQSLGRSNVVCVSDTDIFPPSSVRLHGIKTFQKERIDMAILYAASVLVESSPTLRDTFMGIIQNKKDMLFEVENLTADVGCGFIAWIDNHRVIVGNREMMEKNDIATPTMDFEAKYTQNGERSPIYLAVSGKLFGMFIVSYEADRQVAKTLRRLRANGFGLVVDTDNFTVTGNVISASYGIPQEEVKVLNRAEKETLDTYTAYAEKSEGVLCHDGSFGSCLGGILAAASADSGERMACTVQMVALFFSVLLCLVLSIAKGLVGISLLAVLLYQLVWAVVILLMPALKKH